MCISKGKNVYWYKIVKSFYLASTYDPLLESISGKRSHDHGWGFVTYKFLHGKASISYYRSSIPIASDAEGLILLRNIGETSAEIQLIIAHSRLTSENEVKNVQNTHPFLVHVVGKFSFWLAHNGRVSKTSLAKEVGFTKHISEYSDTFFLATYLAKRLPKMSSLSEVIDILREIIEKKYVISALNIAVLAIIEDNEAYAFTLNYISPKVKNKEEYYKLYEINLGAHVKVIASSTFAKYFKEGEIEPMRNGDIVFLRMKNYELEFYKENILNSA